MGKYWNEVASFLSYMNKHGFSAYMVGGAVRDYLLKRDIHDIDVTTNATEKQITELFPKAIKPSSVFPMFMVKWHFIMLELSPYRALHVEDDLKRRDFTINALAMDNRGVIIDPLGGKNDLSRKIIRAEEPGERFKEDPLRILRMFRFSSELGFRIDTHTWEAALQSKSLLKEVAVERVRTEVEKLLFGSSHDSALWWLFNWSFPSNFPVPIQSFIQPSKELTWEMQFLTTKSERWAAFLWRMYEKEAEHFLSAWRLPKKMQKSLRCILRFIRENPEKISWDPYLIYRTGLKTALEAERVHQWVNRYKAKRRLEEIRSLYRALPIKKRGDLEVNGKDIIETFPEIKKNKIGTWLTEIEKAVVYGKLYNEKRELITFIKEKHVDER